MKAIRYFGIVSFLWAMMLIANAQTADSIQQVATIAGKHFGVIQAAMPEFERRGLKLEGYQIRVIEMKDTFVVIFDDPQRPRGQLGSTENMLTFEVVLRKDNLQLIRANFSK